MDFCWDFSHQWMATGPLELMPRSGNVITCVRVRLHLHFQLWYNRIHSHPPLHVDANRRSTVEARVLTLTSLDSQARDSRHKWRVWWREGRFCLWHTHFLVSVYWCDLLMTTALPHRVPGTTVLDTMVPPLPRASGEGRLNINSPAMDIKERPVQTGWPSFYIPNWVASPRPSSIFKEFCGPPKS